MACQCQCKQCENCSDGVDEQMRFLDGYNDEQLTIRLEQAEARIEEEQIAIRCCKRRLQERGHTVASIA
ncbi:MAG: hypothetical protein BA869_01450 [Desulfuromonadales bacterium C00003107]|jgi:copper chaperone CopZ|nr:MAG: hypothetical protein BA869_01450 [Desulfuromonadales bacterium C00003107]